MVIELARYELDEQVRFQIIVEKCTCVFITRETFYGSFCFILFNRCKTIIIFHHKQTQNV